MRPKVLMRVLSLLFSIQILCDKMGKTFAAEMIFGLEKGQRYCFFETAKAIGEDVLVDFQVVVVVVAVHDGIENSVEVYNS